MERGPGCAIPARSGRIAHGGNPLKIVCLDLEGVLIPEIWVAVAERTGIEALKATTREVPDYNKLMRQRLSLLRKHDLAIGKIQSVIEDIAPLPGAKEFSDWVRERYQLVILSDTFYEFAQPLMRKLGWPTLLCHRLEISDTGELVNYRLRMRNHKRSAVAAFKKLKFTVLAAGDSYNDTAMLAEADAGFLFRAPETITKEFPQHPAVSTYDELRDGLLAASHRLAVGESEAL